MPTEIKKELQVSKTREYVTGYRIEKLIKIADDNLYEGKRNGKNQVVCP